MSPVQGMIVEDLTEVGVRNENRGRFEGTTGAGGRSRTKGVPVNGTPFRPITSEGGSRPTLGLPGRSTVPGLSCEGGHVPDGPTDVDFGEGQVFDGTEGKTDVDTGAGATKSPTYGEEYDPTAIFS